MGCTQFFLWFTSSSLCNRDFFTSNKTPHHNITILWFGHCAVCLCMSPYQIETRYMAFTGSRPEEDRHTDKIMSSVDCWGGLFIFPSYILLHPLQTNSPFKTPLLSSIMQIIIASLITVPRTTTIMLVVIVIIVVVGFLWLLFLFVEYKVHALAINSLSIEYEIYENRVLMGERLTDISCTYPLCMYSIGT